jgi:hypothetical protein
MRAFLVAGADIAIHTKPEGPHPFQDHSGVVSVTNLRGQNTYGLPVAARDVLGTKRPCPADEPGRLVVPLAGGDGDVHQAHRVAAQALRDFFHLLFAGCGLVQDVPDVVQERASVEGLPPAQPAGG